jgi:tetratricopeptide (TPR) repeat protein
MSAFDLLENSESAPLLIAIIGTVSLALAAMERLVSARDDAGRSKTRLTLIYVIVFSTLAINVAMYWFQYRNVSIVAARERKSTEHELALSLWAYTNREEIALKYLARNSKYMLGYYYFRQSREPVEEASHYAALARRALNQSIAEGSFVAPSHYILAVMARGENDLSEARGQLEDAIAYDPDYSSAYQERALLHALQGQQSLALSDLERAVELSSVHCYSVNRNSTDPSHPLYLLRDESRFVRLKGYCEALEADM